MTYETEYEEQCVTEQEQKCETLYDTVTETKCETQYETVYDEQCAPGETQILPQQLNSLSIIIMQCN